MAVPVYDRPPEARDTHGYSPNNESRSVNGHRANHSQTSLNSRPRRERDPDGPLISPSQDMAPFQDRTPSAMDASMQSTGRERSRTRTSAYRRPSNTHRVCGKCGQSLTGQFVRALGDTWHLECFTCHDCDKIVASKFFPSTDAELEGGVLALIQNENGTDDEADAPRGHGPQHEQYPLCETDYFRRLDLLCYDCNQALRGSYITALDRKYHIEHFTCHLCPTVFGATDSYYEHQGNVYCHYHYSTRFAQRCEGCQGAILKQFVEIYRNGRDWHWHPECYMIHKYWNVRLSQNTATQPAIGNGPAGQGAPTGRQVRDEGTEQERQLVRAQEEGTEQKVHWIWGTLSGFEEKSATCISDMLLHVSNGAYVEGVSAAQKFITHVDLLFVAADQLDSLLQESVTTGGKGLNYGREAKILCKKIVAFFQLLAESQTTGVRRLGVTQELLALVTSLAHYLKLLIRICLQGALRLERETNNPEGLAGFLDKISQLESRLEEARIADVSAGEGTKWYADRNADTCAVCDKAVEERCYRLASENRVFHIQCTLCKKCGRELAGDPREARWVKSCEKLFCIQHAGISSEDDSTLVELTRLQMYVHLLRVAHARLLERLKRGGSIPHTSDDPNLLAYDSTSGHRITTSGENDLSLLRSNTRSRSYAGPTRRGEREQSYEDTLGDIKRMRSARMDKHISSTNRQARQSRIIDGPEGVRPNSADADDKGSAMHERRASGFQIIEDRSANTGMGTQLMFDKEAMNLDDIPRILQAQQMRDQRPNASRYARQPVLPQEPRPKFVSTPANGHARQGSGGNDDRFGGDLRSSVGLSAGPGAGMSKKYFSELTALEYFMVRHVAVLSMEPLLEGFLNQEDLLELIETKRPTFWGKIGKAFVPKDQKKSKAVFKVALEQLVERDGAYTESTDGVGPGALRVPAVIQDAISTMRRMDMSVEGVFRKNGNVKRLRDQAAMFDKGEQVDLMEDNPVQVAALLKKFLRELPDPVLTFKLHRLWITSSKLKDQDKARRLLHLTCCLLPKAHRDTMEILFCFLNWVSSFAYTDEESGSKMDIHNLATVIAPNILYPSAKQVTANNNKSSSSSSGQTAGTNVDVDESFLAIEAVYTLIECNEAMCEVPSDIQEMLNDRTLFENSPDITTKEILRRLNERARIPQATPYNANSPAPHSREGRGPAPVATRVDTDPSMAAWGNESSVRHVGADLGTPSLPYAGPRDSTESHGSPNRHSRGVSGYERQRMMGVT
ncbi:Rho-type GTPase activating protein Rga1 [Elasticomyces elasticus]|nr:Rho-type GTPase activating protein Rga1 [Elasticomyces elasticus]